MRGRSKIYQGREEGRVDCGGFHSKKALEVMDARKSKWTTFNGHW